MSNLKDRSISEPPKIPKFSRFQDPFRKKSTKRVEISSEAIKTKLGSLKLPQIKRGNLEDEKKGSERRTQIQSILKNAREEQSEQDPAHAHTQNQAQSHSSNILMQNEGNVKPSAQSSLISNLRKDTSEDHEMKHKGSLDQKQTEIDLPQHIKNKYMKFAKDIDFPQKDRINQLFGQLHQSMDLVDKRVNHALIKNENDFINGFLGKMYNLQKDIRELKEHTDTAAHIKKMNEKIKVLDLDIQVQRQESQLLHQKSQRLEARLEQIRDDKKLAEEERIFIGDQLHYTKQNNKILEAKKEKLLKELENEGKMTISEMDSIDSELKLKKKKEEKNMIQEIDTPRKLSREMSVDSVDKEVIQTPKKEESGESAKINKTISTRKERLSLPAEPENLSYYQYVLQSFQNRVLYQKKKLDKLRAYRNSKNLTNAIIRNINLYEHKFLDAIRDVKILVLERKQRAALYTKHSNNKLGVSFSQPNLQISDILKESFSIDDIKLHHMTETDKIKTMELFLSNEDVLNYVYRLLFSPQEPLPAQKLDEK
jgi:hypothetical protein